MISVVIPNYNGAELLKKNVPGILDLLKKSRLEFELIIVDDASTDDSRSILEPFARPGLAKVVYKPRNEGFPSTVHRGFSEAKGEFVFVIKNDAVPENADYFQLMLNHFESHSGKYPKGTHPESLNVTIKSDAGAAQHDEREELFAVTAGQKTIENGKEEIRGSGIIYFEKGFFLHKRGNNENATSAWPDGSASVYRRDLYFKLGGFDPIYNPGYWEDVDLGFRAWKAGYRIDFEPKAILLHNFESGSFKKKFGEKKIRKISLRNQFIFVWKNSDLKHLILSFVYEPYNHLTALKRGEFDFVRIYWWALLSWPTIILKRIKQRGLMRFSDDEVLKKFTVFLK